MNDLLKKAASVFFVGSYFLDPGLLASFFFFLFSCFDGLKCAQMSSAFGKGGRTESEHKGEELKEEDEEGAEKTLNRNVQAQEKEARTRKMSCVSFCFSLSPVDVSQGLCC